MIPEVPADKTGQDRGNSGIFLQERYEVQVLDSFTNVTYSNGQAGSIYKQFIPLVNASRPAAQWQSYDIVFTAPRFGSDGALVSPRADDGVPQRGADPERCRAERPDRSIAARRPTAPRTAMPR